MPGAKIPGQQISTANAVPYPVFSLPRPEDEICGRKTLHSVLRSIPGPLDAAFQRANGTYWLQTRKQRREKLNEILQLPNDKQPEWLLMGHYNPEKNGRRTGP